MDSNDENPVMWVRCFSKKDISSFENKMSRKAICTAPVSGQVPGQNTKAKHITSHYKMIPRG